MIYAYDLESYPNFFSMVLYNDDGPIYVPLSLVRSMLSWLSRGQHELIGFNNEDYDYHLLHYIIEHPGCTAWDLYNLTEKLINGESWPIRNKYIKQIDLMRVHHFDNKAKMTSLKMIEFNMRMDDIQDLPFAPGTYIQEPEVVWSYNEHDARATWLFYKESTELIDFRRSLGWRWINYSNTKIGEQWMIGALEKAGVPCVGQTTYNDGIHLGDVIFPYISFDWPEFIELLDGLRNQVVHQTKGALSYSVKVDDFSYDFGLGGIHGSRKGVFKSDEDYVIYDWDVASYYPNLAIGNRFYPAHLGKEYCDVYQGIYDERKKHKKGTPLNAALKEALNATFGNSNNPYSPFYDTGYMLRTTVNGQLLLCMLSERLVELGCKMIQINTDGLTVVCPRWAVDAMKTICRTWEDETKLQLEHAVYSEMYVRDVNNYAAVYEDGRVKLKGAYAYDRAWHQNHSALVIPKAVEAHLVDGTPIDEFIRGHKDMFDFMLRTKVRKCDHLFWGSDEQQRICRYYVSTDGRPLIKQMAPLLRDYYLYTGGNWDKLGKIKYERDGDVLLVTTKGARERAERHGFILVGQEKRYAPPGRTAVESGRLVTIANKIDTVQNIDYDYYINRANKLLQEF